jgi:tryptophan 2,3-dioxygenase/ribonuclease HI
VKVVVHVDGGARGNPGPAAAAAVVSSPDGEVLAEAAERIGEATNNVAEYRALLLGLERARELGADEVELVNDSELVAKQLTGEYRVKHPDMKPLHARAHEALGGFRSWSIRTVPRAENAGADALVNQALDADPAAGFAPRANTRKGTRPPGPAFPERTGGTDYSSYLLIDDLLSLQRPITDGAHDELLFIVVHQSYELWFKLILHELERARDELLARRPQAAVPRLRRVIEIERLLLKHLDVLETMSPDGFLEFRDPLAPASGFQSVQFRRIEWVSGLRDAFPPDATPPEGAPLYEAFVHAADLPEDPEARLDALAALYRDHEDDPARAALHQVAELLVDHDEGIALWRHHHVLMAAREIGSRPGTGGSPGVPYLETTLGRRFFPELWDVRVRL